MGVPAAEAVRNRPFITILRYNRPYWREYGWGAALALLFMGIELASPMIIRTLVDRLGEGRASLALLLAYFVALLVIGIGSGIARYWQRMLVTGASRKFEYDIRNTYFAHVQRLSQDFFHRVKTGDVMARATNDVNYVRLFLGAGVMGTVDMVRLPFSLGLMIYLSGRLTLMALVPLPLVSVLVYFIVTYMHRQSKRVQDQFSVVTSRAQENLAGAHVVKAYGIADREIRDFRRESDKYMRASLRLSIVMSMAWPLVGLTVGLTCLTVLWQGGLLHIRGLLSVGDLTAFLMYLFMLVWPLAGFGWVLSLYQRAAVGMNRISEFLTETPTIVDGPDTRHEVTALRGDVAFDHVSFGYAGRDVLHDVSFTVEAGQTVAILGATGSGKSTIVALLTREYDPGSGRVLLDGIDARHVPVRVLRGHIGYVPQDTFLFSDTIRENLTFGRPDATEEQMREACEVAQFLETVDRLPQGLGTVLGERGVNLSGGQKQRLAIARAVLTDPTILILDDALSSVDTHTEERILERLRGFMASRTSVVISHRVSTIRHADLILVLEDGRIAERGPHEELLGAGGIYADLYQRQLLEEQLDSPLTRNDIQ